MPRQQNTPRDTSKPRVRGGGPKEWSLVNNKGKVEQQVSRSGTGRKSQPKEVQQSVN